MKVKIFGITPPRLFAALSLPVLVNCGGVDTAGGSAFVPAPTAAPEGQVASGTQARATTVSTGFDGHKMTFGAADQVVWDETGRRTVVTVLQEDTGDSLADRVTVTLAGELGEIVTAGAMVHDTIKTMDTIGDIAAADRKAAQEEAARDRELIERQAESDRDLRREDRRFAGRQARQDRRLVRGEGQRDRRTALRIAEMQPDRGDFVLNNSIGGITAIAEQVQESANSLSGEVINTSQ